MNQEENEKELEAQLEDSKKESQTEKQEIEAIEEEIDKHTAEEIQPLVEAPQEQSQVYTAPIDEEIPDNKLGEKMSRSFKHWIAGIAVASLCAGVGIGIGFSFMAPFNSAYYKKIVSEHTSRDEGTYTSVSQDILTPYVNGALPPESDGSIVSIAKSIGPSVVSVYNNKKVSSELNIFYSTEDGIVTGLGSGIIFGEDDDYYYIMTNSHVVEGADSLAVNFVGDTKAEAKLVGKDSVNDIAVVKVQKAKLSKETKADIHIAPLGDSDHIEVGQLAIAIGTPATEALNNTVTTGIISAVERNITIAGHTMKVIQTDAAINPGNSGGALVGPSGEVIGMNVAKTVNTEGIGFSIPINKVKDVVADLMENGSVLRPALGITGVEVSSSNASLYDLPIGIYIESVIKGGSADLAGVKAEDVLIQFDGEMITTMTQLKALIAEKRVGDLAEIKVIRSGTQKTFKIELKEMPES